MNLEFNVLQNRQAGLEDCAKHNCQVGCTGRIDLYAFPGEIENIQKTNPDKFKRVSVYETTDGQQRVMCHEAGGCSDPLLICKLTPLLIDTRSGEATLYNYSHVCPVRKFPYDFIKRWIELVCEIYINPLRRERKQVIEVLKEYRKEINDISPSDADEAILKLCNIYGIDESGRETVQLP